MRNEDNARSYPAGERPMTASYEWMDLANKIHKAYLAKAQMHGRLRTEEEIIQFLSLALAGEAGELANLVKKAWRGDPPDREKMIDELADVRIYLHHLAVAFDIDLDRACQKKLGVVLTRL